MRPLRLILLTILTLTAQAGALRAWAGDVTASAPQSLSVTIYRNPYRQGGGTIDLDDLRGFALITETRTVNLPAGQSRLRFEGVVDGIQTESAIVTGLPNGVVEKNRDAAVLSPEALLKATVDADLTLVRTNPKTGQVTRTPAVLRSANEDGVVFQTAQGIEALSCSGLPETFEYSRVPAGLSSTPTLSALVRTDRPITATVTLSYLADGFDWSADYVARVNPDGRTLNLIAWVTLANGNGVSLPAASTQIVAGQLNRSYEDDDSAVNRGDEILDCWPQGSTSDTSQDLANQLPPANAATEVGAVIVTADKRQMNVQKVPVAVTAFTTAMRDEKLGDLKLYRVPEPTTVAAQASKQVRLLDQSDVVFTRLCTEDLPALGKRDHEPADIMLRTKNSLKNNLGLPLPAGEVAVFDHGGGRELLVGSADLHDTAVDEDVELITGSSPDVQVAQTIQTYTARSPDLLALTPRLALAVRHGRAVEQVEITNARAEPTPFELRLRTNGRQRVVAADQPMAMKDGRPIFRLTVPANGSVKVRYAVER